MFKRSIVGFTAVVLMALVSARAYAEDGDPVVTVSLLGSAMFDKPLPSDAYFKLRFAPTDDNVKAAVVRVWPAATRACDQVKGDFGSLVGTKQFHELFMVPGTGDDKAFVARVPPLQVKQRFCVSIQSYTKLAGDLLNAFAANVAANVAAKLAPPAGAGAAPPPSTSKDQVLDTIADQITAEAKVRLESDAPYARTVAGKVVVLLDPQLILAYTAAVAQYNATVANLATMPADKRPPAEETKKHLEDLSADIVAKRTALVDALTAKLRDDSVKESFATERVAYGGARAGDGDTAAAANYAAIDTGVVVAFPLKYAGGNGDPWALPYVGLNLYAVPVDRVIPLSELVDQPWQRVSLTIGRTLSSPTLPNRSITDLGFGYPVVAIGYRITQFVRVTAGSVFYHIDNPNPTSARTVFGVAPFLGMALDGDVIAIGQGKLFPPK